MQIDLTQEEVNLLTQLMAQVPALAPAGKTIIALNEKLVAAQEAA
jgi:hypothetical protein